MDKNTAEKNVKPSKSSLYTSLRVKKDTKKKLAAELSKVNKKAYGRKVRLDALLSLAFGLITDDHIYALQESSLSHMDRLDREYREYVKQNGAMSKDDYVGLRLSGGLERGSIQNVQNSEEKT